MYPVYQQCIQCINKQPMYPVYQQCIQCINKHPNRWWVSQEHPLCHSIYRLSVSICFFFLEINVETNRWAILTQICAHPDPCVCQLEKKRDWVAPLLRHNLMWKHFLNTHPPTAIPIWPTVDYCSQISNKSLNRQSLDLKSFVCLWMKNTSFTRNQW